MGFFNSSKANLFVERLRTEKGDVCLHYKDKKDYGGITVADVLSRVKPEEVDEYLTPLVDAEKMSYQFPVFKINKHRNEKTYCTYVWDNGTQYGYEESRDPYEVLAHYVSTIFSFTRYYPKDTRTP
jgi:hypothetical protein